MIKPTGYSIYGSIPHLPGSRIGKTEKYITQGQADIATKQSRKNDVVIVQEKLDGSCVSVIKQNNTIFPVTKKGYLACQSEYLQHHFFYDWIFQRAGLFDKLLQNGERLIGEWLAQAHGTKYCILSDEEVFWAFDIIGVDDKRLPFDAFMNRVAGKIKTVPLLSYGPARTPHWCQDIFPYSGAAGETIEGYIWRVESKGKIDFLVKWVRPDYVPGKYLPVVTNNQEIWNWLPKLVRQMLD